MKTASSLLINESPLVLLPSLAKAVGINEAIILQQVHYWISSTKSGIVKDGRRWVWNTIAEWKEQFPFWEERTIRRAIKSARDLGCLMVAKHNKGEHDQTNYYSINYDAIDHAASLNIREEKLNNRLKKRNKTIGESVSGDSKSLKNYNRPICPIPGGQIDRTDEDSLASSLTETTAETTKTENTKEDHFKLSHPSPDGCSQTPNKFGVNANAEAELQRENEKTLSEELVECYQDAASQHAAYAEYLASKETKPKRKKPTKQPKRAMFASQVPRKEYPHTYAALLGLEAIIAAKPDHNIWVDGMTGRPMIQTAHIEQVEGNLAALAEEVSHLSSSNDDRIQMMNSAIHDLYLSRGHLREAGTVDLAFLAGVGMKHPHHECEMDADEYAEWLVSVVY